MDSHTRLVAILLCSLLMCESGCRRGAVPASRPPRKSALDFNSPASTAFVNNPAFKAPLGPTAPTGPLLDFFKAFNNQRLAVGRGGQTVWDATGIIPGAVKAHLDDMLNTGYFALVSPSGVDVPTRAVSSGAAAFATSSTVIARGYSNADRLMTDLMLEPRFASVVINYGVGRIAVAYSSARGGSWVIMITA